MAVGLSELMHAKCLEQCLAPRKANVNVSRYYIIVMIVITISGYLTVIDTAIDEPLLCSWFGLGWMVY